jgi:PAS domain S-box-containing protein
MPLSSIVEGHPLLEIALRGRRNPVTGYVATFAAVAAATLVRWLVSGAIVEGVPFITYYPAIIIAALIGGLWPGILATVLSVVIAWYLYLPPTFGLEIGRPEVATLLLFVFVSGVNIAVVSLLNAAIDRIAAQERSVRVLVESAPNGIVVVDAQGVIMQINGSTERLFGYPRSELLGKSVDILVPGPKAATHRALREAFLRGPEARPMGAGRDLSGRRKDGSEVPVEIGLNPIGRNGRQAVLATVIDISERQRAQDQQRLLVRELTHRTKNLFAVVQSIAARSFIEGRPIAVAKELFEGRLAALARAHAMLAEAAWEGAPLAEILRRELAGFAESASISGCDLIVNGSAAQQFALVIHELATNAMKYGALSSPKGRVEVEGMVDRQDGESVLRFLWKESGGPTVSKPTRKGFGSVILVDAAQLFARRAVLSYDPGGLRYELLLSLGAIGASDKPGGSVTPEGPEDRELRRSRAAV